MIVHIHGGALIIGSRKGAPKWLNPQGDHVVISIDYRLAPETKLPAIIEDVQDAFRWIHKKGPRLLNIDTEKLVVAGGSAGGYLTLMTGFCVKPRPKALIAVSGYGGIVGPWYSRPSALLHAAARVSKEEAYASVGTTCVSEGAGTRGKFYLYCRQNGIWPQEVTGHNPDTEPKWFDRYCPVRNVSAKYPPTVLIHGTADTDVPYEESDAMDKALTHFNVPHKFISVPGGGTCCMEWRTAKGPDLRRGAGFCERACGLKAPLRWDQRPSADGRPPGPNAVRPYSSKCRPKGRLYGQHIPYSIIFSFLPTSARIASARVNSSWVWVAVTMVRMRALPLRHGGEADALREHSGGKKLAGEFVRQRRVTHDDGRDGRFAHAGIEAQLLQSFLEELACWPRAARSVAALLPGLRRPPGRWRPPTADATWRTGTGRARW